jgi:hypothetical protein
MGVGHRIYTARYRRGGGVHDRVARRPAYRRAYDGARHEDSPPLVDPLAPWMYTVLTHG